MAEVDAGHIEVAGHELPRWAAWAIGGLVALAVIIYVYKRATAASSTNSTATGAAAPTGALAAGGSDQAIANLQNAQSVWASQLEQQYQQVLSNDQALGTSLSSAISAFQAGQANPSTWQVNLTQNQLDFLKNWANPGETYQQAINRFASHYNIAPAEADAYIQKYGTSGSNSILTTFEQTYTPPATTTTGSTSTTTTAGSTTS